MVCDGVGAGGFGESEFRDAVGVCTGQEDGEDGEEPVLGPKEGFHDGGYFVKVGSCGYLCVFGYLTYIRGRQDGYIFQRANKIIPDKQPYQGINRSQPPKECNRAP